MITSIDAFLRYFDGIHRRAVRDVAGLPPEADGWTPQGGEGERAWSINKLRSEERRVGKECRL